VKKSEAQSLPRVPPVADLEPEADLAAALHEVSNALTVVLGWLDTVRARIPAGAEREQLEEAIDVARTHARLGHRVARRAIGADVHGAGSRERTAHSMARCAVLGVTPTAERRNVTVRLDAPDEERALIAASGTLLQVLTNLLLNAIEFSPDGCDVVLSLSEETGRVVLTVADEGPGIDPDHAARLLGDDAPPSRRPGGAGLGLRHSAALARTNGGELRLLRARPGACFEVTWPIAEPRSAARNNTVAAASLDGFRVLVVEDDAAVRALIEVALQARSAKVVTAASLAELDSRAIGPWSAALVDLSPIAEDLPGSLARLRDSSPGAPIILISGAATGVPGEAEGKVAAWVRKPFEMGEVVDVLLSVLRADRATNG